MFRSIPLLGLFYHQNVVLLSLLPRVTLQEGRQSRTKEDIQLMHLKKKTRKRTRRFEIDGTVITTTTSKVIYGDEENGAVYDDHIFRKQELRELKMLQKYEQKQFQDLGFKAQFAKDQQVRDSLTTWWWFRIEYIYLIISMTCCNLLYHLTCAIPEFFPF